jgi:type VI secretion system ImpA family protein
MSMADLLDFNKLLKEISPETPAGPDLRENATSVYREIKTAWERARRAERKLLEGEETPPPDWSVVLKLAPEAIASKAKDLELAAWLTEALVRQHQFAGLLDGLKLLHRLIDRFWDRGLHPSPEQYGLEDSLRMLAALNGSAGAEGTIIQPINRVPLTEKADEVRPFCRLDYQEAGRVEAIQDPEKRRQQIEKGSPDFEKIKNAEAKTSPQFRNQLLDGVEQCLSELGNLDSLVEKKCRGAAPFSGLQITDPTSLAARLKEQSDDLAQFLWSQLSDEARQSLTHDDRSALDAEALQNLLAEEFNHIAQGESLYDEQRFTGVELSGATLDMLGEKPTGHALVRFNRMLLEEACSLEHPAPAFSSALIRAALDECYNLLGGKKEPTDEPKNAAAQEGQKEQQQAFTPSGPIQSRKQAFEQLLLIAQYFEQTEPHSPIPYALKRIVRWGDLPLPQLLVELIQDQNARNEVYKLVGITEDAPKSEG